MNFKAGGNSTFYQDEIGLSMFVEKFLAAVL
jgi:hypothetical protein